MIALSQGDCLHTVCVVSVVKECRTMMHPDTTARYIGAEKGIGIVATADIPVGTIVYVYDAMEIVLRPDDPRLKNPLYQKLFDHFSFADKWGNRVVCWDHGRYMNHCCHPNTLSMTNGCNIVIAHIRAGEELTEDYGLWRMVKPMPLVCQKSACRKIVGTEDNPLIADACDRLITQAILQWRAVPQAMMPEITTDVVTELDTYLQTGQGYQSVRGLLCPAWE